MPGERDQRCHSGMIWSKHFFIFITQLMMRIRTLEHTSLPAATPPHYDTANTVYVYVHLALESTSILQCTRLQNLVATEVTKREKEAKL